MFLITGCGRSGTKYMAKALNTIGLSVGHEELGGDGAVSAAWTYDATWYPRFHQQGPRPKFDLILHQVRFPLHVIGSVSTSLPASWRFNCDNTPIEPSDPMLVRCAKYWYYWNLDAQAQAVYTYRIEALPEVWDEVMSYLGVEADYEQVAHISKRTNRRKHMDVTWADLERVVPDLVKDIQQLALSYGYEL